MVVRGGANTMDQQRKRNTKLEIAVLELLQNNAAPMSAKQICNELVKSEVSIWPSTVYRILDRLLEIGEISPVTMIGDTAKYYETISTEHRHSVICLSCQERVYIHICPVEILEKQLLEQYSFMVTDHKIELYGYCKKCAHAVKTSD